ncbi:hypothetical protein RHSIM_Rhsim13G0204200 [Rhododendron simsii]|uniref:Uncharacterized protein n=1 Tax=Rhododendron simsii TaxID=118357 RepID=A0A834G120_RHOSS|nr:hypothetical protein RHSIM_Rhsim13G0204200 [Rhododendron simsii]
MAPPSPKRSLFSLFLLLLLSLSFLLLLFSLYPSSSSTLPTSHFSLPALHSPPPPFTLTVKLLAFDRLSSLSRCLRSLSAAHYGPDDRVNLHIFIDHFKVPDASDGASLDVDARLNGSRRILDFVDGFRWGFGDKVVHYRTGNVGLQAQWLEAWWPGSDDEFAFVVEDDLEVSPLYYKFLKGLIGYYYYNASNFSPWIYGASLQRPRFVPGKHGNKLQLDSDTRIFLYQLVGTWGQLLFPRPWKEFRLWYDAHKTRGIKPFLQGMVTSGWYKRMGERIWTPWFIKFIHSHGYFNLYTSFSNERALSISHRDAGVNYGKTAGPDSNLLDLKSLDFDLLEMQPLSKLKWYDYCFRQVLPNRVVSNFNELGYVLHSLQKMKTIILVNIHKVPQTITRNLLCHFEGLNIQNYILVGPKSYFLLDLARRGHPVIDVDQFFDNVQSHKVIDVQGAGLELIKDILVKAYVVEKTLELGYNTWVVDGNMLPVSSNMFLDVADPSYDFYAGNTFKVLLVRSSSSAKKIWVVDFIRKVVTMAESSKGKGLVSMDGRNFASVAAKVLEQRGVNFKGIEEMNFGVDLNATYLNQTSLGDGKKMIYWSFEMEMDLVRKRLEEIGMWIIDGDSSCRAVVCHQS